MFLIVGLGNPGKKYENTWHNLGFLALDNLQSSMEGFSRWAENKKFLVKISGGQMGAEKILLAKPLTFMNNSGKSARAILNFYKLTPENLIVIHDDIDLPLGEIKIVKARGSAGHKGVESVINEIGTNDFTRVRIGICPAIKPENVEDFVLEEIKEKELADSALEKTKIEIEKIIR
jgi:PTH1 family peptidyl-tRNA hydrolase